LGNKRDRNQPRGQACKQKQTAPDLKASDEARREMWKRHPEFSESSHPLVRIHELQKPFPEKHTSHHKSQDQDGFWTVGRRIHQPCNYLVHWLLLFTRY